MQQQNEIRSLSSLGVVKSFQRRGFSLEEISDLSRRCISIFQKSQETTEKSLNRFAALGFTPDEIRQMVLDHPESLKSIVKRVEDLKTMFGLNMLQIRHLFLEMPEAIVVPLEKLKLEKIIGDNSPKDGCIVDLDTILSFATFRNYIGEREVSRIARFIGGETLGIDLSSYDDYDICLAARELLLKSFPELKEYKTYGSSGIGERTRNALVNLYGNEFVLIPRPNEMIGVLSDMEGENAPVGVSHKKLV